jgi:hypothetical protein
MSSRSGTVTRFYNERGKGVLAARPNAAHEAITRLEDKYNVTVISYRRTCRKCALLLVSAGDCGGDGAAVGGGVVGVLNGVRRVVPSRSRGSAKRRHRR